MTKTYNINIEEFQQKYRHEYNFLYDNRDNVAGYTEAVQSFDEFAKAHSDFVKEFVDYTGDFVSSDREAAAFMFALNSFV